MIGVAFWAEYALNQSITAAAASAGSASSSIEELETAVSVCYSYTAHKVAITIHPCSVLSHATALILMHTYIGYV